jgi:type IV secretion system protein VirB5
MTLRNLLVLPALLAPLAVAPPAHAQFAVIDVASLTQLISQVNALEQQVATARNQLAQAQSEYQSITGSRGMQALLGGTVRNYLPPSWSALQGALQGGAALAGAGYPLLAAETRAAEQRDAVLSARQLAVLSPAASAQLQASRRSAALLQGMTHEALANSSGRFAAIQQLIDAITRANDQKGILELQARIGAESGMLQNEHTKLQVLYQGAQAEGWANAQRQHELAIAGHGSFQQRFQPRP